MAVVPSMELCSSNLPERIQRKCAVIMNYSVNSLKGVLTGRGLEYEGMTQILRP